MLVTGALALAESLPPWSYEGSTGPAHWGSLSYAYRTCSDGSAQSPVDVKRARARRLRNIVFDYQASADVKAVNTGHTVEWDFPAGSASIAVDGVKYPLIQMHFHTPSEHRVGGHSYPLEIHVVHKTASGAAAVVGFLVKRGAANRRWAPLVAALPASGSRMVDDVDLRRLMPSDPRTFRYMGSLTTPPCDEGVHWNLMRRPIEMSAGQIARFRAIFDGNRRPVQPLNGRTIVRDTSRGS